MSPTNECTCEKTLQNLFQSTQVKGSSLGERRVRRRTLLQHTQVKNTEEDTSDFFLKRHFRIFFTALNEFSSLEFSQKEKVGISQEPQKLRSLSYVSPTQ
jgi:hypothetical protein